MEVKTKLIHVSFTASDNSWQSCRVMPAALRSKRVNILFRVISITERVWISSLNNILLFNLSRSISVTNSSRWTIFTPGSSFIHPGKKLHLKNSERRSLRLHVLGVRARRTWSTSDPNGTASRQRRGDNSHLRCSRKSFVFNHEQLIYHRKNRVWPWPNKVWSYHGEHIR